MKKKISLLAVLLVALFANITAIRLSANDPGYVEPDSYVGPCYQTMSYCDMSLTYSCQKSKTSEACRLHVCWSCQTGISQPTY